MKRFRFLMLICILFAAGCSSSRETSGAADRASWLSSMIRIADPVLRHAAAGTLKEVMPYESPDSLGKRRDFACLEALGRTLCGIAPWLELDGESDPRQAEYRLLARRALSRAVDPSDAGYLTFDRGRQPLVDAAYLAEGVLRAKRQLWTELDAAARANLTDALKRTRTIRPGETNWLLFASMVEAALLELTGSCDTARMRYGTDRFLNDFYKGDGMYGDGKFFHMDYYNSYVIHPMLLDVLTVMERHGLADSCTLATERRRHTRYAAILERMVAPDGSYPVLGRSITACPFRRVPCARAVGPAALASGRGSSSPGAVRHDRRSAAAARMPGQFRQRGMAARGLRRRTAGRYGRTLRQYGEPVPLPDVFPAAGTSGFRSVLERGSRSVDQPQGVERRALAGRPCLEGCVMRRTAAYETFAACICGRRTSFGIHAIFVQRTSADSCRSGSGPPCCRPQSPPGFPSRPARLHPPGHPGPP